ncbi:MAG TPA: helix-turn-helix domain-containing protein [Chthonomonadales bacterium]|nr:helix-turn-helix domain-containing protein [Chthonomonadales bacterium]
MPDPAEVDPSEARRRKLDALFDQQPFLSPTMRAWLVSSEGDVPGRVAVASASADAERSAERRRALQAVCARAGLPAAKRRRRAADAAPARVHGRAANDVVRLEVRLGAHGAAAHSGARPEEGGLLTAREVASYLRLAPATVRRWVRDGRLAAARAGRLLRFRHTDVQAVLRPAGPECGPRV